MNCKKCKHAFQAIKPDGKLMDEVYGKYYNYPSPMLSGFAQEREKIFLKFFFDNVQPILNKKGMDEVLEIACFDGFILYELSKKGFKVCGCDPSKGADIAKSFGIKVHKECFDSTEFIKKNKYFDIIISRHFIEHVKDPVGFLKDSKKNLTEDGLIVIETPNVEYYLESGSFETFNLQHLQNFSIHSIIEVVEHASLNLVKYEITPENLIVVASKKEYPISYPKSDSWDTNVKSFKDNLQENINRLHSHIKPFVNQNKKIVLWGAGGLCGYFPLLYKIDENIISYVVDIDDRKWDMSFINNNLEIHSPEKMLSDDVDLIIITSMYSKEIIKQIKEMKIDSDVINLHPEVSYIYKNSLHSS